MPSAVKMQSPYHWTAREFPVLKFAKRKTEVKFPLSLAIGRTSLWLSLAGQTNSDSLGLPGSWALRKEKRNSCYTFIKRLFSSSLFAIRVVSSAYLRLLIFILAILILACDFIQSGISHHVLCIYGEIPWWLKQ